MSLYTESQVLQALRSRYPKDAYALFPQLADQTGANANRYADAVVMGLWPSRGLYLEGIEIKVRKNDLKKELHTPEKAEAIAKYCDKWWLAVGDKSILDGAGLIPENWGVLGPDDNDNLEVIQKAEKTEAEDLNRKFIASVFRRAQEQLETENIDTQSVWDEAFQEGHSKGYSEGYNEALNMGKEKRKKQRERIDKLEEAIESFRDKTGIDLMGAEKSLSNWDYDYDDIGKAVKRVLDGNVGEHRDEMKRIMDRAKSVYKTIKTELNSDLYGTSKGPESYDD